MVMTRNPAGYCASNQRCSNPPGKGGRQVLNADTSLNPPLPHASSNFSGYPVFLGRSGLQFLLLHVLLKALLEGSLSPN